MSRHRTLQLHPEVERFEEKLLQSTGLPSTHGDTPLAARAQPDMVRSSHYQLVSVSTPLPAPVARVQADHATLRSGTSYTISTLEIVNGAGMTINAGRFSVTVPGSTRGRAFPEAAWHPGQVLVFFAEGRVQNFEYNLAGATAKIPPNIYFNVVYNPSTFTTTLHSLINGSFGVGGRFKLV
jgi:hypothetical protein